MLRAAKSPSTSPNEPCWSALRDAAEAAVATGIGDTPPRAVGAAGTVGTVATHVAMPAPDFLYLPIAEDGAKSSLPELVAEVSVAPAALFAIIDHFLRRDDPAARVIGVLVGCRTDESTRVEVRNSLPLKHVESEDEVTANTDYLDSIVALHQKVFPDEEIVGWYSTGTDIVATSVYIHDFFSDIIAPSKPIHFLVDTALTGDALSTRAFVSSELSVPGTQFGGSLFSELPCSIQYDETDRVGLNLMLEYTGTTASLSGAQSQLIQSASQAATAGIAALAASATGNADQAVVDASKRATQEFADTASALLSDMSNLEHVLAQIKGMLSYVTKYVEDVRAGKLPANATIGEILMETVSLAPKMDSEEFTRLFNNHLQDLLMVVYLGNLTKLKALHS